MSLNRTTVALLIIILTTIVTLGLVAYETIRAETIPAVVQTLLGVVIGFLGNNLASAQGAEQALSSPPPTVTTPTTPPSTPVV